MDRFSLLFVLIGLAAIVLPGAWMSWKGIGSGEQAGTVLWFGVAASLFQVVTWGACIGGMRTMGVPRRRVAISFGFGSWASLLGLVVGLALWSQPVAAVGLGAGAAGVVAILTTAVGRSQPPGI